MFLLRESYRAEDSILRLVVHGHISLTWRRDLRFEGAPLRQFIVRRVLFLFLCAARIPRTIFLLPAILGLKGRTEQNRQKRLVGGGAGHIFPQKARNAGNEPTMMATLFSIILCTMRVL
jgi:hypothetical protein